MDNSNISLFCFALVLWLILISLSSSQPLIMNLTTDEYSLLAFKTTITSNPNGILLSNWSIHTPIRHWLGVSCSPKHGRVTALNVSGFHLSGTIAPHLGNLTFLRSLDISSNNFTGSLPSELSKLRRLKYVNAGSNNLTGEIPPWFGALSRLEHMHLNSNSFSGRIPASLFNISSRLQTLDMEQNYLDGDVAEEIGFLNSLETLNLKGNKLTGSIPSAIFNISTVVKINLGMNKLSGKLPNDVCRATPKLKILYLHTNDLDGEIPLNLYKCRELQQLGLSSNNFNGSIHNQIGNLTNLKFISLFSNEFGGIIPKQVGNLTTSLMHLILESNSFTGELPQELGNLAFLKRFPVAKNLFSGPIPPLMFNISTLQILDLAFNQFSGNLPSEFSLFNLQRLTLHSNTLSGPIPSRINNASQIIRLELESNLFSGSIPNLDNLRLLNWINIGQNNFTGTKDSEFLSSLTSCRYLEVLLADDIRLNGLLPTSIGNLSTSLWWISMSNSYIKGVIPSEIGNLSSLAVMELDGNHLNGLIPKTIGKLKQLQRLDLFDNQLQGYIPADLCELSSLGELFLHNNSLTGPIPECLGEVGSLRRINLGSNHFNSTIPSKLWNLRDLLILDLSSNCLSGQLSSQIENLKVINLIDLSSNQMSGEIPSLIDGCQLLEFLYLSNNKFEGSIPQSLRNVKGLVRLDLSNNSLSGMIPSSLEGLRFLQYFNASDNRLQGEIPNTGPFVNFTAQSFARNSGLCGAARFEVPPCAENHGRSKFTSAAFIMKYILAPFTSAVILAIIAVMVIKRRQKGTRTSPPVETSTGVAWRIISYNELVQGTNSFSETSILGRGSSGSVFKGTLCDGLDIAVKVFNLELESARQRFDTERKILGSIRHRNLVGIVGCCSTAEFKALILAYMPNGSLEKWLYSDNYHHLDLLQMLEIAIGVALALEHLHHGHTFPVVHCDVKPSNVLLDEDMNARLSDFGISKLFDEGEIAARTKTIATIGYVAPEYGSEGRVSTKGDVYSYGIMLLEMCTHKRPTDNMFSEEMSLKEWVNRAMQECAVSEVVAPGLLLREDQHFYAMEQCVSSIFDLAMKCLAFSPEERISMVQVVTALQKINVVVLARIKHLPQSSLEPYMN